MFEVIMPTKPRKGPQPIYGPKEGPPRTHLLTPLAKEILAAVCARTGAAESNVVEHLVRRYGATIPAEDLAPSLDAA